MENKEIINQEEVVEETEKESEIDENIQDQLLSETESAKIMSDIKIAKAIDEKKNKKSNKKSKKKNKQKHLYSAIILSITIGIVCGGVGLVGGYFIYNLTKPEAEYAIESSDLRSIAARGDASTDLLKTFETDPYNLVNYSFIKFARKKSSFTIYNNIAQNISGDQNTNSISINKGGRTFFQTHSKSDEGAIVNIQTALRFYDEHDEVVTAYEYSKQSDWVEGLKPTNIYTYDEYMLTYGKLNQGLYVINDDLSFLSLDTSIQDGEWLSGVSVYQITNKSVKDCIVKDLGDGKTEINMVLYTNRACFYECRQIKANGGFSKNPTFTETLTLSYVLDENFDLFETRAFETYKVNVGIEADVVCNSICRYYYSDTDDLYVEGQKIEVPRLQDPLTMVINLEGEITL